MFADKNANGIVEITGNASTNEILQENHYYPFGLNTEGPWMNDSARDNRYQYNGKEWNDDFGLNWNDYGARWYDAAIARFTSVDRFAEKYSFQSPYDYAANNPIKFIDVNGDSIWIATEKNGNLLYENGNLYNKDGSFYEGKVKGSLKQVVKALGKLGISDYGSSLISTLSSSTNNFIIKHTMEGVSRFAPDIGGGKTAVLSNNAYAFQVLDQGEKVLDFLPFDNIGSGGDINWNPGQGGFLGLGHEIGHAVDGNYGALDSRRIEVNGEKEEIREIRAVYHENRIRQDLGKGLRKRYQDGPGLLDNNRQPINQIPPFLQKLRSIF